ncbi:MAG: OsmC family peroxiredoxin [Chitinivibrionales bacterium]|nr:OsmC family peroxiredoxin [Chitinivibrionales bacterium]
MPISKSHAQWRGAFTDGTGTMSGKSGAFTVDYSKGSRFEDGSSGSNPEELIGAALSGCFSQAFAKLLEDEGHSPQSISTSATTSLEKRGDGFAVGSIVLDTEGEVAGLDADAFKKYAQQAKSCPVSQALQGVEIALNAKLLTSA